MNVVKKHAGKLKGSNGGLCLSLLVLLVLLIVPGLVLASGQGHADGPTPQAAIHSVL